MNGYLIEDKKTGQFLTHSGGWNAEYPEAEIFPTFREASNRLRRITTNRNPIGIVKINE